MVDLTSTSSVGRRKEEWIFDFEEITGWRCIGPDYSSIQLLNKLENQGSLEEVEVRIQGRKFIKVHLSVLEIMSFAYLLMENTYFSTSH